MADPLQRLQASVNKKVAMPDAGGTALAPARGTQKGMGLRQTAASRLKSLAHMSEKQMVGPLRPLAPRVVAAVRPFS